MAHTLPTPKFSQPTKLVPTCTTRRFLPQEVRSQCCEILKVNSQYHLSIIGDRGTTLGKICKRHNVHIQFPDKASGNLDEIAIIGFEHQVQGAKEEILHIVNELHQLEQHEKEEKAKDCCRGKHKLLEMSMEEKETMEIAKMKQYSFRETIQVDSQCHLNIVGRYAATLRKIRRERNVYIKFPMKDKRNRDKIVITGSQAQRAKDDIFHIITELEEQISEEIDIDHHIHGRLMGAKGKAIGEVMHQFNVVIHFPPDKETNTITIVGMEKNVQKAKEHLLMVADHYKKEFSAVVDIDHRVHGRLIGAQGRAIARVRDQFNVVVLFPSDRQTNTVTIIGMEKNVEEAKQHLLMAADRYMQDVVEENKPYSQCTHASKDKEYGLGHQEVEQLGMDEKQKGRRQGKQKLPDIGVQKRKVVRGAMGNAELLINSPLGARTFADVDPEDLERLCFNDIVAMMLQQREKECMVLANCTIQEKTVNVMEWAKRQLELPLLEQYYQQQRVRDRQLHNQLEEERVAKEVAKHHEQQLVKARLGKMSEERMEFTKLIIKKRRAEFKRKVQQFELILAEKRKELLKHSQKEQKLIRKKEDAEITIELKVRFEGTKCLITEKKLVV